MKRFVYILIFWLLTTVSMAQNPAFRLHVQAAKAELAGDGDDYTTVVVTARDAEGEVIPTMNGTVKLQCSAGFLEESDLKMENGIAYAKYTAPIFGQPIKAAQRMVYFTVKFIRKFLARFGGSTDMASNQKLAGQIALETIKEGTNPFTLIPKKEGDNNVYFVAGMKGVKGKTKILINKASEGGNSALLPGYYSGYDVTGQAQFDLVLESGGRGQMTQGGTEAYTVLFTNEKSAEINSAMQKMMGGGEWMNAYMGASERDMQYMEGYDVKKNGLPSIYLPMPNNGIFLYVPPILLEYQGRPKEITTGSTSGTPQETEKQERVFVTLEQNELIGDGRSQTKAIFHYEDINGTPVSGKNISWSIPKDFKVISVQNVTDVGGNAIAVIQSPVLKAKGETRGENTGQLIDNYDLYKITVNFSSPKRANDYVETIFSVYKTIEKNIRILKAGFETAPIKILLPQLEQYKLESSIYALVEMINSPSIPDKFAVNDAIVFYERKKFDAEYFNRNYEYYFKKDRKMFMSMLDDTKGGFMAITDANGNFKLDVGGNSSRILKMEPLQVKLSDLTGRRKGELGKTLKMFDDAVFVNKVIDGLFRMDKDLCAQKADKAVMTEEKLHLIGMLMVNANTGDKLMKDTEDELISQGWELMKSAAEYANEKWKITDKLYKKLNVAEYTKKIKEKTGLDNIDKICDSLGKLGVHYDNAFWKAALAKDDYKYGTKKIIQYFLAETVLPEGAKNNDKARASATYYKLLGSLGGEVAGKVWEKMSESISEALSTYVVPTRVKSNYDKASKYVEETKKAVTDYVPDKIKEAIQAAYYSSMKEDILRFFDQSPENVHTVYPSLQEALRDRSTELRAYYSSVAAWRYGAEMLKAYVDLSIDLVVKSIVVIVDAYSGNWTEIPKHFKKLDDGKKTLGTAFTAGGFAMELYRLNNLWAEVISSFVYANKCISRGTMPTTMNNDFHPVLFPSAYAAAPPRIAVPNITLIDAGQLKCSSRQLPVAGLNMVFNNSSQLENWYEENFNMISRLAFTNPEKTAALFEKISEYRSCSEQLATLSIAVAADPGNAGLITEFNKTAEEASSASKDIKEASGTATQAMNNLTPDPGVNTLETKDKSKPLNKWFIYGGAGLSALILLLGVIFLIRRKRKNTNSAALPITYAPIPQVTPSLSQSVAQALVSPAAPSSVQPPPPPIAASPKFCPQCGTPFKPGAKFCGKCGYKTI